jgi:multicomponent Na+:H+ antiporter subunit C
MMLTPVLTYSLAGIMLVSIGLSGLFFCGHWLRKILAVNLAGSGVFLIMVALARRQGDAPPDPVPHALVLTGIVVAVSATAVALVLYRRLATSNGDSGFTEEPRG